MLRHAFFDGADGHVGLGRATLSTWTASHRTPRHSTPHLRSALLLAARSSLTPACLSGALPRGDLRPRQRQQPRSVPRDRGGARGARRSAGGRAVRGQGGAGVREGSGAQRRGVARVARQLRRAPRDSTARTHSALLLARWSVASLVDWRICLPPAPAGRWLEQLDANSSVGWWRLGAPNASAMGHGT